MAMGLGEASQPSFPQPPIHQNPLGGSLLVPPARSEETLERGMFLAGSSAPGWGIWGTEKGSNSRMVTWLPSGRASSQPRSILGQPGAGEGGTASTSRPEALLPAPAGLPTDVPQEIHVVREVALGARPGSAGLREAAAVMTIVPLQPSLEGPASP